jgi:hypothetical protein
MLNTDSDTSLVCQWASRYTVGVQQLHEVCPGHVVNAWDGREFDCACPCHRDQTAPVSCEQSHTTGGPDALANAPDQDR